MSMQSLEELGLEACDTCGKPILPDEGVYTLAVPGPRHYECHVSRSEKLRSDLAAMDQRLKDVGRLLGELKGRRR